jgi:hypothetical protein
VRSGTDYFDEKRKRTYAWGHAGGGNPKGAFADETLWNRETNTDVLVTAMRGLSPDLTLTVNAGANRRDEEYKLGHVSVTELSVPGIYTLANAGVTPTAQDFTSAAGEQRLRRGEPELPQLPVRGRDGAERLVVDAAGGQQLVLLPVHLDGLRLHGRLQSGAPGLSSGKVRASWTRVGNDADPYQTSAVLAAGTAWGGIPAFSIPTRSPTSPEAGGDHGVGGRGGPGFLNERVGFVATYYDNTTVNQIMGVQISRASGFTNQVLNAGEVRNWGTELLLNANPVRLDNGFRWDMTLNWAKNNSEVVDLYGDLETLVLGTYWSLNIEARKGEPYGVLFGNGYLRDDQGKILVTMPAGRSGTRSARCWATTTRTGRAAC